MKNKSYKKYDITQCALYKCRTKRRLALVLQSDVKELTHLGDCQNYYSFEIDKKNSDEKRKIVAPKSKMKRLQRRILFLLNNVIRPDWLISSEKGKNYIDNGKTHVNGCYLLTVDIRRFFDSCNREAVYQFFIQKMKVSPDVGNILTNIITTNNGIPTGCPTSQIMAFYAYYDMFVEIADLAKEQGCVFTLYVDDMTFSSDRPISNGIMIQRIASILAKYNHRIKYSKIRYYGSCKYKNVTGTIISPRHILLVPNNLQQKVFMSYRRLRPKLGNNNKSILAKEDQEELEILRGRIQVAQNIEVGKFSKISECIKKSTHDEIKA